MCFEEISVASRLEASEGLVAGQRWGMTRLKFDFPGVSRMLIRPNINTREKRWQFAIAGTSTCQVVVAQRLQAGRHVAAGSSESTWRAQLEEAGFEALQRLYAEAVADVLGVGRICARFLLGLYNGNRFPFDLTDLRLLPTGLLKDAVAALHMDARLTRQEVHLYFADGGRKFEDLVSDYRVVDVERLRNGGDGRPRPSARSGTLCQDDHVSAKLITYGNAPGYRDVTLTLDCEVVGGTRQAVGRVCLEVNLGADDAVAAMQHIQRVNAFAWKQAGRGPLDLRPGERRPAWLG